MDPLVITCPDCQYQFDLLSGLQGAEQRDYMKMVLSCGLSSNQLTLMFRYLAMFKPLKNAMSYRALKARSSELIEHIWSGVVVRDGNTRAAPPADWFAALEHLVTDKPANLSLPLKSHSYLYALVFNAAEKAAAKIESKHIQSVQSRPRGGSDSGAPNYLDQLQEPVLRDDKAADEGLRNIKEFLTPTGESS